MSNPEPVDRFELIQAALREIGPKYHVREVEVFGSVARGDAHEDSDIDLLVEFLPDTKVGLFEMGGLKEDLEERLGCRVDLLERHAVERSRNPYRRAAILAAPISVYAR